MEWSAEIYRLDSFDAFFTRNNFTRFFFRLFISFAWQCVIRHAVAIIAVCCFLFMRLHAQNISRERKRKGEHCMEIPCKNGCYVMTMEMNYFFQTKMVNEVAFVRREIACICKMIIICWKEHTHNVIESNNCVPSSVESVRVLFARAIEFIC